MTNRTIESPVERLRHVSQLAIVDTERLRAVRLPAVDVATHALQLNSVHVSHVIYSQTITQSLSVLGVDVADVVTEGVLPALVLGVVCIALGVRALELVEHVVDVFVVAMNELAHRVHCIGMLTIARTRKSATLCGNKDIIIIYSVYCITSSKRVVLRSDGSLNSLSSTSARKLEYSR